VGRRKMTNNEIKRKATKEGYTVTDEMLRFARWLLMQTRRNDLALQARNIYAAIDKEREACAVLCETECAQNDGITCAEEIRRRGEL
jgi:hypothetical protein